ncbi:cytochrome b [Aliishimia ponticola]|uniref:Cytochrome b n=1 Tax=Aliishimia ponticola TaxID=2499833 RepID=A0A4S4N8U6_9RHOB|nr:cytochrome b/b6 domain-containing protein [Aliishimia ponticola]THH35654.1 cytochrome b [Aliishimia ponticola]
MATLTDTPLRYGLVSRIFHWGMALLFLCQFASAAAHWALPRENALLETLWSYHTTLGTTLFLLVLLRGLWGLSQLSNRPEPEPGLLGRAALLGHLALYALMVIIPLLRLIAAAGGTRGLSYLGIEIFAPRAEKIAWMDAAAEWHGELGWLLFFVVIGHILMAVVWHNRIQKDDTLRRMA